MLQFHILELLFAAMMLPYVKVFQNIVVEEPHMFITVASCVMNVL